MTEHADALVDVEWLQGGHRYRFRADGSMVHKASCPCWRSGRVVKTIGPAVGPITSPKAVKAARWLGVLRVWARG